MLTVPTAVQGNLLQCLHNLPPQVTARTRQNFELYIKSLTNRQLGCLYDAILSTVPVRHWQFNDLFNLLLNETPIFASGDGLVCAGLKSASAGGLFWFIADDADFHILTAADDAPASPIVVLTCETKIVHGHFDSITSYRAEGTGLLVILFLAAHLLTFLNLDSPPQINHNCDNQELIVKVKSILPPKWDWRWYDVTDSYLICETLHWDIALGTDDTVDPVMGMRTPRMTNTKEKQMVLPQMGKSLCR